jgi:cellulose synthase/poly-beta-1,6-N-acetylglucosamine synthase-like glycosyltransferase
LLRELVLGAYFACLCVMALYGLHRWHLLFVYLRHRRDRARPPAGDGTLPHLTVQLPLYNELHVAERLVVAVAALDWPRERLEVQVLDDSTDETTAVLSRLVDDLRAAGLDIVHLRRGTRAGFKAGALAHGLARAKGELIAVFDADFVPRPDFARRLCAHFADAGVGMVQARWGHLNADHSALTRLQSLLLDGHFVIEHAARAGSGRFFNFNGTAGVWRKRCIVESGGWQHDTLTEDLDLSYRAQLAGWRFVYVSEHVAPAELPVEMGAFKTQQHRWAKGSIQTARKLLPRILASRFRSRIKLESLVHLTANAAALPLLLLALLVVPAVFLRARSSPWLVTAVDLPLFAFSTVSIGAFYLVARREASGSWRGILGWIPLLMALGIGMSVNNARAVLEGLTGRKSEFRRTPKYGLRSGEGLAGRRYRATIHSDTWIELALAIHFAAGTALAAAAGLWAAVPFLCLFLVGFSLTSATALGQALAAPRLGPQQRRKLLALVPAPAFDRRDEERVRARERREIARARRIHAARARPALVPAHVREVVRLAPGARFDASVEPHGDQDVPRRAIPEHASEARCDEHREARERRDRVAGQAEDQAVPAARREHGHSRLHAHAVEQHLRSELSECRGHEVIVPHRHAARDEQDVPRESALDPLV